MMSTRPSATFRQRPAFTLVELLAAMAVLTVLVTVLTAIFSDSQEAWSLGVDRGENVASGRSALQWLARDLAQAVTDTNLTFVIREDRQGTTSYGFDNVEVCFASLSEAPGETNRAVREVHYWVADRTNRYELVRAFHSAELMGPERADHGYDNPLWHEDPPAGAGRPLRQGVVADHVAGFRLGAPDAAGDVTVGYDSSETANSNRLPRYVDVYLEVLNDREARQAADMLARGLNVNDFVERHVIRYTHRVFFRNGNGYRNR